MSSYRVEWCKDEDDRCGNCPMGLLQRIAPEVGAQTLRMIDKFGLEEVADAVEADQSSYDSYRFGMLAQLTGTAIQSHEDNFRGHGLAQEAIKQIAANHGGNNF